MIRKLRTQRDNQQWMLDLALNLRGRVQNFERDDLEVPKRVRNYRMIPKAWREAAERHEELAKRPMREVTSPQPLCTTTMPSRPTAWHSTPSSLTITLSRSTS